MESLDQKQIYVAADLMVLRVWDDHLQIMLTRRETPPYQDRLALPGRFIRLDESAEMAAGELVREMLPGMNAYTEQLYTFTAVNRDPRGRVISTAYLAILPGRRTEECLKGPDSKLVPYSVRLTGNELHFCSEDGQHLSEDLLAFDHAEIIRTGIQRLRGKISYTGIGFRFLNDPNAFTLVELQSIFEAVLDAEQDSSNFRRFIRNQYEHTGKIERTGETEKRKHQSAILYRMVKTL